MLKFQSATDDGWSSQAFPVNSICTFWAEHLRVTSFLAAAWSWIASEMVETLLEPGIVHGPVLHRTATAVSL